ncbi:MAG: hypothetical protein ACYDHC_04705 [Desulfuromonadaceae bacterium]
MVIQEAICPECGSPQHYVLKDNRLQCAFCRKKYTLLSHRSKLSLNTLEHIALSFSQMTPATATAAEMGVNSKTIQKYYDLLRRTVAEANEKLAVRHFGTATISPALFFGCTDFKVSGTEIKPLFCLVKRDEGISLLFARNTSPDATATVSRKDILGWVYARDNKAFDSLDLDRIHFISTAEENIVDASRHFWTFAKKGLVKYHGGFRKRFYLFMREMEFRFNNHGKDSTRSCLFSILQEASNTTETGDDNVQV